MKKLLLSFTLAIALLAMSPPAFSAAQEGIAAIVNDSVITMTDIKDRTALYLSGSTQKPNPDQLKKMQQQVLDRLIDESLQMQEAKKLDIVVAESDVTAGFADLSRQNNVTPEEFKKRLAKSGVNIHSLYDQIKADLAWSQVVRRKLRPQVDISESEIDLTLNQIASGSGKTQYHIAEIFLPVANAAEENDRRDAAENIVKKVNEGESFAAEAHQYSQAPGAAGGGDLGWVQEGQLDPELDRALEKMQPGQLSAPIRTNKGYHILLLRDIRHSGAASAENAPADEDQIISLKQIFIPVTKKDPENVVSAKFARGAALKGEINSCKRMSAKMKNFPSPGTTDLGKGKLSGLPQEMRAVVRNLKIGELSAPLHTPSGFAMIMVCSRQKLPAAGEQKDASSAKPGAGGKDEPSRDQIASKLGMARLDQMAERYLHDLRATAFIDKRI